MRCWLGHLALGDRVRTNGASFAKARSVANGLARCARCSRPTRASDAGLPRGSHSQLSVEATGTRRTRSRARSPGEAWQRPVCGRRRGSDKTLLPFWHTHVAHSAPVAHGAPLALKRRARRQMNMMGNAQWKVPGLGSRTAGGRVVGGLTAALLGCALLQTAPALAQEEAEAEEAAGPPGADGMDGRSPEERELGDGTAPPSETEPGFKVTDPGDIKSEAEDSPIEKPGETYYFVGLRYRGIVVPKFMQNMFGADGGRTVYVDNIGPEVAIRKDNFEYIFSLTWADYSLEPTPFKGSSDEEDAWEIIESEINMIYLKADFMWT